MKVTGFFRCVCAFAAWLFAALVPLGADYVARIYADQFEWRCYDYPIGLIWTGALLVLWGVLVGFSFLDPPTGWEAPPPPSSPETHT